MKTVINIIPSNYSGNPREALGYAWQDIENAVPGHDIVVERTDEGIDYKAAARAAMKELGISDAHINCMWCGGYYGDLSLDDEEQADSKVASGETVATIEMSEAIAVGEQENAHKHHQGYCTKCHSYCYGDCEASW